VREWLLLGRERGLQIASLSGVVDPFVLVAGCVMASEARDELYPAETVISFCSLGGTMAVASLMVASLMFRAMGPLPNACDRCVFELFCVCARVSFHSRTVSHSFSLFLSYRHPTHKMRTCIQHFLTCYPDDANCRSRKTISTAKEQGHEHKPVWADFQGYFTNGSKKNKKEQSSITYRRLPSRSQ